MFECFFARAPGAIHSFQRAAKSVAIGLVIPEDPLAAVWKIVMMLYGFRIEFSERNRIAQVIKKQLALLWNLIEGNGLDAQSSLFRRAMTGNFGGAQFGVCSCRNILRGETRKTNPAFGCCSRLCRRTVR